jgi:hypothetical protein
MDPTHERGFALNGLDARHVKFASRLGVAIKLTMHRREPDECVAQYTARMGRLLSTSGLSWNRSMCTCASYVDPKRRIASLCD